jgi:ATP-dependent exoDNAse (exonuclease V) beta subunit
MILGQTPVVRGNLTSDGKTQHLLSGAVELLYCNANGWHLIDYKTDQLSIEALSGQYGGQIRPYAKHWSSLAGGNLVSVGIYSVREQRLSSNLMTA